MALTLKENMQMVLDHKEPEYMPMWQDFDMALPRGLDYVNECPCVPGVNKDWFGQSWTYEPTIKAANPTPGSYLFEDITMWKDVMKFPDLDRLDWEKHAAEDTADWDRDRRINRVTIGYGLWERMFCVMPFQEALCALVEEPEACYDFFGAVADHKIRLHEYIIKYYKPDMIVLHDDYGSNSGMFMSPEVWRSLIKPHLKRVIDHVTSHGVIYEHHCCGYLAPILEEIADLGAISFNSAHISNNIPELKKRIEHKIAFLGGFDTQYVDAVNVTDEQALKSARDTIDQLAPGGSWVPRFMITDPHKIEIINREIIRYGAEKYYGTRPKEYCEMYI